MPSLAAFPSYTLAADAKIASRTVSNKRLNNVRQFWFVLGALFGLFCSLLLNGSISGLFSAGDPGANIVISAPVAPQDSGDDTKTDAAADTIDAQLLETFAATQPQEHEAPAGPVLPAIQQLEKKVASGDTLIDMLTDASIAYDEAAQIVKALRPHYNPRDLRIGQRLEMALEEAPQSHTAQLAELSIPLSPVKRVSLTRDDEGGYTTEIIEKELTPELTYAGGTITNSLFETGMREGIPDGVLAELVQAYSYDVDFQRSIHNGDKVEVLFERMKTEDGEAFGYGKILYAMLKLRDEALPIYRFESKDGSVGFYNEKGESIIKALLRTPVNGARISSGYGNRRHPILGYNKMHKGTDFAAPTGTPIYAAGDGTVVFKGQKGGYGNYIKLKHNDTYQTAYAHMSRFGKGMRNGAKVKQGQVIGYVGSTGRSTGPHLHYEVHKNGTQVNPMAQKFKTGKVLQGTQLAEFKQSVNKIKQQVATMPKNKTTVASAEKINGPTTN